VELKKIYVLDMEIVKKASFGNLDRLSLPKFPAIASGGTAECQGCEVSPDQQQDANRAKQYPER